MKYVIKDLAKITGLSPARIRKWQERHGLLQPEVGENGYHYYTNEDLFILNHVNKALDEGMTLSQVVRRSRDEILNEHLHDEFTKDQLEFVRNIAEGRWDLLAKAFNKEFKKLDFSEWVLSYILNYVYLVGNAWNAGYLSVADEHAFSRWFIGYFHTKIDKFITGEKPKELVVVYPKDEHELGALLYFGLVLESGRSAKFCGVLPEQDIIKELYDNNYETLAVSLVIPRKMSEIKNFEKRIQDRFDRLKIKFGGSGYQAMIKGEG